MEHRVSTLVACNPKDITMDYGNTTDAKFNTTPVEKHNCTTCS